MNALRASWRLIRVLIHVLQGVAVLALLFPRRDRVGQQWHIQNWSAGLLRCLGLELSVHQQAAGGDRGVEEDMAVASVAFRYS